MKLYIKIILLAIFISTSISCMAEVTNYSMKNSSLAINITQTPDNNVFISKLIDLKTNIDFINEDSGNNFWTITVKKSQKYTSDEIYLYPTNAENLKVNAKNNKIIFTWTNVKNNDMQTGFDVVVTGELKNADSYWDINIKSNTKDYGIWEVKFPDIKAIDTAKGTTVLTPKNYGTIRDDYANITDEEFNYPYYVCPFQFASITKKNSTLFLSPLDLKSKHKKFGFNTSSPYKMNYTVKNIPDNMGVGGFDYNQEYKFNIGVLKGDWFDATKRYRKWGIDNNFASFAKGKIDQRKDFPKWAIDNTVWFTGYMPDVPDFAKFLDVPGAVHMYGWFSAPFDTHYPDFFPTWEDTKDKGKILHDAGLKTMYYTNSHLIDKNTEFYKKYGDYATTMYADMKPYLTGIGQNEGGYNYTCCPTVPEYQDQIVGVENRIVKEFDADAIYLDELCADIPEPCYNKLHPHKVGSGGHWVAGHNQIVSRTKKTTAITKGKPMLVVGEASTEGYTMDAWLALIYNPTAYSIMTQIYSGYIISFGFYFNPPDFDTENAFPAINKTATMLVWGYQLGWGWQSGWSYRPKGWEAYPDFCKYIKDAAKARYTVSKYFSLGEKVREVNIKTDLPTISSSLYKDVKFPVIKTCSFNYQGSTCVLFTNISKDSQTINFESTPRDLYLKQKPQYTIKEVYPNEKDVSSKNNKISGNITIGPLETKVYIIN